MDDGRWTMDDRRQMMDDRRQMMDDGRRTTDDKGQTTEDRRRTTEDRRHTTSDIRHPITVEVDRRKAIRLAINMARKDDILLIAGKGHENYQIIGTKKSHFSDKEIAQEYLAEWTKDRK